MTDPHRLTLKLQKSLTQSRRDSYCRVSSNREDIDAHVGPESVSRALRIVDAFIKTAESRGFTFAPPKNDRSASHVLEYLDLGIEDGRVELYGGVDLHQFMPQVSQALSDKEAILRDALSCYVSDVFDFERKAAEQYWSAIG